MLLCLLGLLETSSAVLEPFPSTKYLGLGYNLIAGNPQSSINPIVVPIPANVDDGWRFPILQLDSLTNITSNDSNYIIPGNTVCDYIGNENVCNYHNTTTNIITGDKSYSNMLFSEINWYPNSSHHEDNLNISAFSVSPTYLAFHDITSNSDILLVANSKCPTYHYYYNPKMPFKLTEEFKKLVENKLSKATLRAYYDFLDVYGTHVAVGLYCGSRYARIHQIDQNAWNQMNWNKYNIPYIINAEYQLYIDPNAPYNSTIRDEVNTLNNSSMKIYQSLFGAMPIDWKSWLNISKLLPYPYEYTLMPIMDLISETYFPGYSKDNITQIRQNMQKAIETYCIVGENEKNCSRHSEDSQLPVTIVPYSVEIQGNGQQNCHGMGAALSCGIATNLSANPDKFWSIYPKYQTKHGLNLTLCAGRDNSGAELYSVCVNTTQIIPRIVHKNFTRKETQTRVSCNDKPLGAEYKLTGCGMVPNDPGNGEWDPNKAIYGTAPYDCNCYHKYGGICYAICSNSVDNIFTPRNNSDGGWSTLKCSSNTRLFGCGIQIGGKANESGISLPSFYPIDQNTCAGYSKQSYTLYAICGNITSNL